MVASIDVFSAFETKLDARLIGSTALVTFLEGQFVYNHVAYPEAPGSGYVIYQNQTQVATQVQAKGNYSLLYYIKGVVAGPENIERAAYINTLIRQAVNEQPVDMTADGYLNFRIREEGGQKYPDNFGYWHHGGLYRVLIEEQ